MERGLTDQVTPEGVRGTCGEGENGVTKTVRGKTRRSIVEAHHAAVDAVLRQGFLGGRRSLTTPMAAPDQQAERLGNLHLHIHCLVPNLLRTRPHG